MKHKERNLEDIITTLDDRDNVELFMFEPGSQGEITLQSALEESDLNKK